MKMNNKYILGLLGLMLIFTACEKIEPDFFDEDFNGAYFDYENSGDFVYELNFSDHTSGMPEQVVVPVRIKLLGYLTDEKRSVSIKTKSIEGYELPKFSIPEVFFTDKEYEKEVEVMVERPEKENDVYAVCLYLDGEGDVGAGIKGKEEYYIYVTEKYEVPELWSGILASNYLGQWSKDKQIFLTNFTSDNDFLRKLYSYISENQKQVDYKAATSLNASIFNKFFSEESAEDITIAFPILPSEDQPEYNEPFFWNKYSEHKCNFTTERFFAINKYGKNLNTTNIEDLYINENEKDNKKMRDAKRGYHVEDVLDMLEKYNSYASNGYPISEYKDSCWIEMITKNIAYYKNIAVPYWWEDPDNRGTKMIVESYFGEYSESKYQFMMQCIIEKEGSENFVAARMFPFIINSETEGYDWDQNAGGEEYMKECYRTIKKKYDSMQALHSKYTFPERPDLE